MALSSADSLASFDQTASYTDISPVLATILLADTATLGLIGMGEPALKADHRYNEDSLNDNFITAAEALDNSETTFDITDASKLRVGALLRDQAAGKSEILQVTAISTNALTVVRGYGSTDAETHADAATFTVVGQPVQEGDETISDISAGRSQVTNYTQIFKRTVKTSGTLQAETSNGQHPGVPNEMKYQIMQRSLEMKVELNTAALLSVISSDAGSDSSYRSMKGLREFLTASGGNSASVGGPLTEAAVNAAYRAAWDDGGDPRDLIGNADQITRFAGFNSAKLRVAPSDRVAGVFVEKYLTEYGAELSLTMDRWMPKDEIALIDKSRVFLSPLKGRGLALKPLAPIGDAERAQLLMETTLTVKNATKAHAYRTGLSV